MALQIFKFYHQESNINLETLKVIKMPFSGQTLSKKCRRVQLRERLRQGLLRGRLSSPFCSMWLWSRFFGELLF